MGATRQIASCCCTAQYSSSAALSYKNHVPCPFPSKPGEMDAGSAKAVCQSNLPRLRLSMLGKDKMIVAADAAERVPS